MTSFFDEKIGTVSSKRKMLACRLMILTDFFGSFPLPEQQEEGRLLVKGFWSKV